MVDISILICVYNGEKFIQNALTSALNQDVGKERYEIVVVNDGSTDGTLDILLSYQDKISLVSQENKGLSEACNVGIEKARGKYFVRLDADDSFELDLCSKMLEYLMKPKINDIVGLGSYRREFYSDKNIVEVKITNRDIFKWIACGTLFSKEAVIKVGGYRKCLFEEYDLLLRLMSIGVLSVVDKFLYNYVIHGSNMTLQTDYWRKAVIEFSQMHSKETLDSAGFYNHFKQYYC